MRPEASPLRCARQSGITIVELVIGLLVAGMLAAFSYRLFLYFNAQAIDQQRISKGQNDLLPIQESLEMNLRRLGYGIPIKGLRRRGPGSPDTLYALEVFANGSLPDGIAVRGNFDGVIAQTRSPFPIGAADMELKTGSAGGFAAGDTILVQDGEFSEYLTVQAVSTGQSKLTTGARINDYTAGSNVVKVNRIEFRPSGTRLAIIKDNRSRLLTQELADLRIYCIDFKDVVDSLPPFQPEAVKSIQYRVKIRVPKSGKQGIYIYREASGRVLLRNAS